MNELNFNDLSLMEKIANTTIIKVIGVGERGCGVVDSISKNKFQHISYALVDCDKERLDNKSVEEKYCIDLEDAEHGKNATSVVSENPNLLIVVASVGDVYGARMASNICQSYSTVNDEDYPLTAIVVTVPSADRSHDVSDDIAMIEKQATVVCRLDDYADDGVEQKVVDVVTAFNCLILGDGLQHVDYADIVTVLSCSKRLVVNTINACGKDWLKKSVDKLAECIVATQNHGGNIQSCLLEIRYSSDNHALTMDDVTNIIDCIVDHAGNETSIIWSCSDEKSLGDSIKLHFMATL